MATQSRIGWRPYVTQVVNAIDADATAFIAKINKKKSPQR